MLGLVAALLPVFIRLAEVAFPAKGAGPAKKADVKAAVIGLVGGIAAASKGGQANTWKAVETILSAPVTSDGKDLIDFTVDRIFEPEPSAIENLQPSG